jgi:hypothetical protein
MCNDKSNGYKYKFLPTGTSMGMNFYPQPLCGRMGNCSTRPVAIPTLNSGQRTAGRRPRTPAPRKRGRGCGGAYPGRPPLPQARNPSLDTSVSPRSRSGWHHFAPASCLWLSVLTIGAVGLWGSQAFGQISGWHPLAPELVFGNLRICCCNARSSIILAIGRIRHKYGTGYSSSVCGV